MKKNRPLVSICIPTLNRGKILYERMLNYIDEVLKFPVEIVVSDNGSDKWCDYYEKIAAFADKYDNFIYHRNPTNLRYARNIKTLMEISNGTYALYIADEDYLDKNLFPTLMEYIEEAERQDVGFIVVKSRFHNILESRNFTYDVNDYYSQIKVNMMMGYLSGMCFRRSIIIDNGFLNDIETLIDTNFWVAAYIHCYFAARISCRKLSVYLCESEFIIEGEEAGDNNTSDSEEIGHTYQPEGRADEFEGALLYLCNEDALDINTLDRLIKDWLMYIFKLVTLAYRTFNVYYSKHYSSIYEVMNKEADLLTGILQKYDILNDDYKEIIDSFRHE